MRSIKRLSGIVAFVSVLLILLLMQAPNRVSADPGAKPGAIRVAPPAPGVSDGERLTELASRRARVATAIGQKAVLILFSGEPRVYANDVSYQFRQENNLYYLTNLKQDRATLVLLPGNKETPEILFIPRRNSAAETWTGHMYGPEEAAQRSGVREIWEAKEFGPFLTAFRNHQPYRPAAENILLSTVKPSERTNACADLFAAADNKQADLYLLMPSRGDQEFAQEKSFAAEWRKTQTGFNLKDATPIFTEMRLRKSPLELRLLQHAIDISTEAHERAWVNAASAKWEYEVDAQVAYTFKLRNADNWGYPDIVGCGPNATTLHYEESQGPVTPGQLLLMDVGAEYDHYSADVTRTFPVNGKFTTPQAQVYQIVYDAQEAAAKAAKPGATLSDVNRAATEVIKDGLLRLGLITDRNSQQHRIWFMHGTSHFLGMNVHDLGNGGTKLEPGMVFTNEPGIYVRLDALENLAKTPENEKFIAAVKPAFEKYKGIGVRIEDDMVITATGVRWMTEALPRKLTEIEAFIAGASGKR